MYVFLMMVLGMPVIFDPVFGAKRLGRTWHLGRSRMTFQKLTGAKRREFEGMIHNH